MTGGGTAGHVVPNLAIADAIIAGTKSKKIDVKISYIGSHNGIERKLLEHEKLPFYSVSTGKLRRYFDLKNFIDLFKIPLGICQAWILLGRLQPDVVFSKGGFVGFPVVVGAWFRRIPVVIHESDAISGLATKLSAPFAERILLAYEQAKDGLGKYDFKIKVIGTPVRKSLLKGSKTRAKKLTGFSGKRPVLLVVGGSTGSQQVNDIVALERERLMKTYDVIHLTGKGKGRKKKEKHFFSLPYAQDEMKDLYALASLALSRAGSTALAEHEALGLPTLLYPLGLHQSRGDQIANAKAATYKHKFFRVADETKSASSQLKLLPKRSGKRIVNNVADKIANLLLKMS